jgi:nondiscriminating glutamyl-tRNA synthetase
VFDEDKLAWANRHYLKTAVPERIVELALPFLRERSMVVGDVSDAVREWLLSIVPAISSSLDRLSQVPERLHTIFSFDATESLAREAIRAELASEAPRAVLRALADDLADAPRLTTREIFRAAVARVKEKTGQKGRALLHPIRVVLTGEQEGPELDLLVPAIDRATDLTPASGIQRVTGCRERAASFATALSRLGIT